MKPVALFTLDRVCSRCGAEYRGLSFQPPVPGEGRRPGVCELCIDAWEHRHQPRTGAAGTAPGAAEEATLDALDAMRDDSNRGQHRDRYGETLDDDSDGV